MTACWWCLDPIVGEQPSTEQVGEGRLLHYHPGCLAAKDGWLAEYDATR